MIRLTYGNSHHTTAERRENTARVCCPTTASAALFVYEQRCEFFEAKATVSGEDLTSEVGVFVRHLKLAEEELRRLLRNKVIKKAMLEKGTHPAQRSLK